jgi:hypothetical protein
LEYGVDEGAGKKAALIQTIEEKAGHPEYQAGRTSIYLEEKYPQRFNESLGLKAQLSHSPNRPPSRPSLSKGASTEGITRG